MAGAPGSGAFAVGAASSSGGFPAPKAAGSGGFPAPNHTGSGGFASPTAGSSGGFAAVPGAAEDDDFRSAETDAPGPMDDTGAAHPAAAAHPMPTATNPPGSVLPDDAGVGIDWEEGDDSIDDPYIGTTISDRYVVDAILGEGGMGRVYLAHHKIIDKQVAIKILHAELAKDKEAVGRFVREAKAASSIGNSHIVDISDFGELRDGSTYFVMEYLDGGTLADLIEERGSLDPPLIYELATQMCDGLAAAHQQQIIHRDLKPDNVTLVKQGDDDLFCKILDFGIAKVSTGTSNTKLTMAGAVFGTPHYMSPEQAAGAAVDHRTDIYSLGVMMYEMASGDMPFNADNFMGILTQHMYKAPVPIRALVAAPDCPPGLEALILKCLSKKPDARYQSMGELAADIRKLQQNGVPDAVQEMMARSGSFNVPADYFKSTQQAVVPATPTGMRRRKTRWIAVAGAALAIGLVLLVVMRDAISTAESPPPETTRVDDNSTKAAEPSAVSVLLVTDPVGATGSIGDQSVELPETIQVVDGKAVQVSISMTGYESETVELTGAEPRVEVKLKAKAGTKRPPATARTGTVGAGQPPATVKSTGQPPPPPPPPRKSGEIVDPWAQ